MVGEATRELVKDRFWFRELDKIRVVGKRVGVRVFELLGDRAEPCPLPKEFLDTWEAGILAFKERDWAVASNCFDAAQRIRPEDEPCRIYLTRCQGFLLNPPPPSWEGVFDLTAK
jgi:adenylate cyclase